MKKLFPLKAYLIPIIIFLSFTQLKSQDFFRFGFLMGADYSYIDYGDLNTFNITQDGRAGVKAGFNFQFEVIDFYSPRVSTVYTYQNLRQDYTDPANEITIDFQNHLGGIELIPLAVKFGNFVKGGLSAGLYYNYLFLSQHNTSVNGVIQETVYEFNRGSGGWLIGIDLHLKDMFFELRYMESGNNFIESGDLQNQVRNIQFLINL